MLSRRKKVSTCCLLPTCARSRECQHRRRRLEEILQAFGHTLEYSSKLWTSMIDQRLSHFFQYLNRNRCWARNTQILYWNRFARLYLGDGNSISFMNSHIFLHLCRPQKPICNIYDDASLQ